MILHPRGLRGCRALGLGAALGTLLAGCAPAPAPRDEGSPPAGFATTELDEMPVPAGGWRGHRLARCAPDRPAPPEVEALLALSAEYFQEGSGSDGMVELEMALADGQRHPLLLLVLGQLYVLAGQGEPSLLPNEGPAADTGDWERNRSRLLGRARELLEEAATTLADDAAVDYLLADAARAAGRFTEAEALVIRGWDKCTGGRSFDILLGYQQLGRHAPRLTACDTPTYPAEAVARRAAGVVTLDVLLDPGAEVRQIVPVAGADEALIQAAAEVFRSAVYDPARVGKYPVWAWLRVSTSFALEEASGKAG